MVCSTGRRNVAWRVLCYLCAAARTGTATGRCIESMKLPARTTRTIPHAPHRLSGVNNRCSAVHSTSMSHMFVVILFIYLKFSTDIHKTKHNYTAACKETWRARIERLQWSTRNYPNQYNIISTSTDQRLANNAWIYSNWKSQQYYAADYSMG